MPQQFDKARIIFTNLSPPTQVADSNGDPPSGERIQPPFRSPVFGKLDLILRRRVEASCILCFRFSFSRSCHDFASSLALAVDTGRERGCAIVQV